MIIVTFRVRRTRAANFGQLCRLGCVWVCVSVCEIGFVRMGLWCAQQSHNKNTFLRWHLAGKCGSNADLKSSPYEDRRFVLFWLFSKYTFLANRTETKVATISTRPNVLRCVCVRVCRQCRCVAFDSESQRLFPTVIRNCAVLFLPAIIARRLCGSDVLTRGECGLAEYCCVSFSICQFVFGGGFWLCLQHCVFRPKPMSVEWITL